MIAFDALIWRGFLYALVIAVAIRDTRSFTIENFFSIACLMAFAIYVAITPLGIEHVWQALICFSIAFGVGFALFALNVMGGGDVKFFASLSVWFSLYSFPAFLVATAIAGGIVGVIALIIAGVRTHTKTRPPGDIWRARVPYGVAIAGGFIFSSQVIGGIG